MSSLLSLGLPAVLAAAAPLASADRAAVEETIRHYFRSGDENAVSELEIAFHSTLGMFWVGTDGTAQELDRHTWAERLRAATTRQPADAPLLAPAQVDSERKAIREVLARTFQAMDAGDGARLGTTALARAETYAVDRGELIAVSVPGWQARLDQARAQGKARPSAREVDWVVVASDVAVARMTHGQGADRIVGYGSLLRLADGGWKLVGLVYGRP